MRSSSNNKPANMLTNRRASNKRRLSNSNSSNKPVNTPTSRLVNSKPRLSSSNSSKPVNMQTSRQGNSKCRLRLNNSSNARRNSNSNSNSSNAWHQPANSRSSTAKRHRTQLPQGTNATRSATSNEHKATTPGEWPFGLPNPVIHRKPASKPVIL